MKKIQKFLRNLIIFFFGSTILAVLIYKWAPVYVTPLMVIRCGEQMLNGEKIKLRHQWVPMEEISRQMPLAVMASEDQRFLEHHGFDFEEINKAIKENRSRKRQRGASTISQQTAKNVFLWPSSSWIRKGFEVYFTFLIELFWSKERIMEVYLNSIEMGDGIYGVEAVALMHFNINADRLTRTNSALIAATLPNPRRYSSLHPSGYVLRRQTWIMRQMRNMSWK